MKEEGKDLELVTGAWYLEIFKQGTRNQELFFFPLPPLPFFPFIDSKRDLS